MGERLEREAAHAEMLLKLQADHPFQIQADIRAVNYLGEEVCLTKWLVGVFLRHRLVHNTRIPHKPNAAAEISCMTNQEKWKAVSRIYLIEMDWWAEEGTKDQNSKRSRII